MVVHLRNRDLSDAVLVQCLQGCVSVLDNGLLVHIALDALFGDVQLGDEGQAAVIVLVKVSGDNFLPKKYATSGQHQLYKINDIIDDGDLVLQTERYQGGIAEDE